MKWREPELGMETVEAKEQTSTTWLATDAQVVNLYTYVAYHDKPYRYGYG